MADDGATAFWRDDAKLWVHQRGERLRVLIPALICLAAIACGVYFLGKSVSLPGDASTILSCAVTVVSALAVFSLDLYFKGGNAAADLKAKHKTAITEICRERDAARDELTELKSQTPMRQPTAGEVNQRLHDFVQEARSKNIDAWPAFDEWFSRVNAYVHQVFLKRFADELIARRSLVNPAHHQRVSDGVRACVAECSNWLVSWQGKLSVHEHINPSYKVPA